MGHLYVYLWILFIKYDLNWVILIFVMHYEMMIMHLMF